MKLLAVTACASGVAHTFMAAEALEKASKERGHQIKVETQGLSGIENRITSDDIKNADAIILTKDMPIRERERFEELAIFNVSVKAAIKDAVKIIEAIEANCK